ncbi:unnamed protein product [Closterium sp. Yama58-4]|nr:unnamed protein product [Closterium sp. Yama58-4]
MGDTTRRLNALLLLIFIVTATQGAAALGELPNTPCEGDSSQSAHFWWPRVVRGRSALDTEDAGSDVFAAIETPAVPRKLGAQWAAPSAGPTFAEVLAASVATPGSADPAGAVTATPLPAASATAAAPAASRPVVSSKAAPTAPVKTPTGKSSPDGLAKGKPASDGAAAAAPASLPAPKQGGPTPKQGGPTPKQGGLTPKQSGPTPKQSGPTPKQSGPSLKQSGSVPKLHPIPKTDAPGPKQTLSQPKPATFPPNSETTHPKPGALPLNTAPSAKPLPPLATTKAVNSTGAAGNTTTPAGNSTGPAGNSTDTPGTPSYAVGSRDCQYQQVKQLHLCALGFAQSAGIRGGQWPTSSLYEVDTEDDTVVNGRPVEKSLRYALMNFPDGVIITFSRSMEIVLQSNLFLRSRVTIDGRGVHVRITNGSIVLQNVNDVIIHNIEVSGNPRGDLIPIYNSSRVWIDHCRLQDALTGTVDVARGSTDVTISNCYISSRGQTMQLGLSDTEDADKNMRVTIYRNWFNTSGSMQPLCRKGRCHVANNLYTHWSYYCLAARRGAQIRSEKNFFRPAPGSARLEVTPWYRGMPATDVWSDATVTIASFQDYLAGGATFNKTAYAGPTPIFTPPYTLTLPRNPRQMAGILRINCGPKYDVDSALPPASGQFLPPAPPTPSPTTPPATANTTATGNSTTAGNSTTGGNSTVTAPSPPSSNDCQYSTAGAGIALGSCAMGFAAPGLVGGAGKSTYVVTLEEDSTSDTRQGSLRWGISNFYKTGAVITFARDMTIQLMAPLYVKSFMTLDGRGANVKIVGDSLLVQHSTQVIIHNIEFSSSRTSPATISLYNTSSTWIDHCRFSNLSATLPAIELARNSTAVTISNNLFSGTLGTQTVTASASPGSGTGSALHLGQSDSDGINRDMNVTVYRNWFQSLSAMQPICRLGKCHVANNLYTNWTGSAVEARAAAQVLLQSNLFISGPDSVQVVANTTSVPPGIVAEAGSNTTNTTNVIKPAPGAAADASATATAGAAAGAAGAGATGAGAGAAGAGATAAAAGTVTMGPTVNATQVFTPPYDLPLGDPNALLYAIFMKLNAGPHAN